MCAMLVDLLDGNPTLDRDAIADPYETVLGNKELAEGRSAGQGSSRLKCPLTKA
jgi:hypothetical protein